nr:PREDICTED: apomucin-like [Lepisosteus oculatus]XP_015201475.1 PREDICTED: apomucin-like [Lepisosteus oculatus]
MLAVKEEPSSSHPHWEMDQCEEEASGNDGACFGDRLKVHGKEEPKEEEGIPEYVPEEGSAAAHAEGRAASSLPSAETYASKQGGSPKRVGDRPAVVPPPLSSASRPHLPFPLVRLTRIDDSWPRDAIRAGYVLGDGYKVARATGSERAVPRSGEAVPQGVQPEGAPADPHGREPPPADRALGAPPERSGPTASRSAGRASSTRPSSGRTGGPTRGRRPTAAGSVGRGSGSAGASGSTGMSTPRRSHTAAGGAGRGSASRRASRPTGAAPSAGRASASRTTGASIGGGGPSPAPPAAGASRPPSRSRANVRGRGPSSARGAKRASASRGP